MNSILDAVMAAQRRNTQEDRLREQRQQQMSPVLSPGAMPILPLIPVQSGQTGPEESNNAPAQESPADAYARAVAMNKAGIVNAPVIGIPIGIMNNLAIRSYEKENPELALEDPARFARPFSLLSNAIDAALGRTGMVDNIGAFPSRGNFNLGGYGDDANSDISGSIDSTDQSPSVGIGDDDGTAVA